MDVAVRAVGLATLLGASLVLPAIAQDGDAPLEADLDTIRAEVDAFITDAEIRLESGRFDDLQPVAIAARAEGDPDRLLEWVTDNTLWAPYLGTLRGIRSAHRRFGQQPGPFALARRVAERLGRARASRTSAPL